MYSPPPIFDVMTSAPQMGLHLMGVAVLLAVSLVIVLVALLEVAQKVISFAQFRIARKRRENAFRRSLKL